MLGWGEVIELCGQRLEDGGRAGHNVRFNSCFGLRNGCGGLVARVKVQMRRTKSVRPNGAIVVIFRER